jgi:rhamnosyltransferase
LRISIIIRTLNEGAHLDDLLAMVAMQETGDIEVETVVIDSGSTDATVEIAERHGCKITYITKSEFSFGRSLNRACAFSTGDVLVFISGHCVPVGRDWLKKLCDPVIDGTVAYSYGRQIGDDDSYYSERRIFAKYFPEVSKVPQEGFFCNNANSALARSVWEKNQFDEDLTGLEDMELAKRLTQAGLLIGYVADATIFHHHSETWPSVRRRFEREAMALRRIMPEVHLSRLDMLRCIVLSVTGDWISARRNGITSADFLQMFRYRYNQYLGSFIGNQEHRVMSRQATEQFFYPISTEKDVADDWLKSHRRTSPHESKQSAGERQELSASARQTSVPVDS